VNRIQGKDVYIAGVGSFSPGDPIPFDDIERVLGPLTEAPPKLQRWIERIRPIMKEMLNLSHYHYALDPRTRKPTEDNVTMAVKSAHKAMSMAGVGPGDIDLILYAGIVMENICPPTSVLVQDALNVKHCAEFSIHSNCTCIYKALQVGSDLLANGRYKTALLVTSQISSAFLRAEYFNQAKLEQADVGLRWFLCDGAGALVLTTDPGRAATGLKVVDTYIESAGVGLGPDMYCRVGGHRIAPREIYAEGIHHLKQNFHQVARLGPPLYIQAWANMVKATGLDLARVKHFIMNIPTKHMNDLALEILGKEFDLKKVNFYTKLSERGYPGPCAILLALDNFLKDVKMQRGDLVVSTVTESSKWMHGGFVLEQIR